MVWEWGAFRQKIISYCPYWYREFGPFALEALLLKAKKLSTFCCGYNYVESTMDVVLNDENWDHDIRWFDRWATL